MLVKPSRSQLLLYKSEKIPQGFIQAADEQTEAERDTEKSPHPFRDHIGRAALTPLSVPPGF